MTTWAALQDNSQLLLDDTVGAIHSLSFILSHLEYGELFLSLTRGEYEKTGDLALIDARPSYTIHDTFSDYIRTLRITINNVLLKRTTLATVSLLDPSFYSTPGVPEFYYSMGGTLLGFYPVPNDAFVAKVTYLAVPPNNISDTATSPYIQTLNHTLLPHYAAAIGLGREGDVERAIEHLKLFMEGLGRPLSKKFVNMLRQARKERQGERPVRETSE